MKYFFDTEFIEGFKKPIKWLPTIGSFNKPYHSIQLISIGIVAEDGREYYAISNEYNYWDASDWVKDNVIFPMYRALTPAHKQFSEPETFHWYEGKTNKQISFEIMQFTMDWDGKGLDKWLGLTDDYFKALKEQGSNLEAPEFYAYYADYDWVVFCSLFGTMMDLPKGFPMYCRDLKQSFDEMQYHWATAITEADRTYKCKEMGTYSVEVDLKKLSNYPTQQNEHNALDDAKWNFELYKFLQKL